MFAVGLEEGAGAVAAGKGGIGAAGELEAAFVDFLVGGWCREDECDA